MIVIHYLYQAREINSEQSFPSLAVVALSMNTGVSVSKLVWIKFVRIANH